MNHGSSSVPSLHAVFNFAVDDNNEDDDNNNNNNNSITNITNSNNIIKKNNNNNLQCPVQYPICPPLPD